MLNTEAKRLRKRPKGPEAEAEAETKGYKAEAEAKILASRSVSPRGLQFCFEAITSLETPNSFYRAMLCISVAYAVMRCLCVCLSRS